MVQVINGLTWTEQSDANAPLANYVLDFSIDREWQFTLPASRFNEPIFPVGVVVDATQIDVTVNITAAALRSTVVPFTRINLLLSEATQTITFIGSNTTTAVPIAFYIKEPPGSIQQNTLAIYNAVQQAIAANFLGSMNPIINAEFIFWPEGFGPVASGALPTYGPEGWCMFATAGQHAMNAISFAGLAAQSVPFGVEVSRNAGSADNTLELFGTALQSNDSYQFFNNRVTVSFDITFGADFSPGSGLIVSLIGGSGFDDNVMAFTASTVIEQRIIPPSLATQRFTFTTTAAVPNNFSQLGLLFARIPLGVAGANDWYLISRPQFDIGEVAQVFRSTPEAAERDRCQSFFEIINSEGLVNYNLGVGQIAAGNTASFDVFYKRKRVIPAITYAGAAVSVFAPSGGSAGSAIVAFINPAEMQCRADVTTGGGMVVGHTAYLQLGATSRFIVNARM